MIQVFSGFHPPGGLGNIPAPPPRPTPGTVGSIPRGFFEIAQPAECDLSSPAFIRGMLMPRKDYDALPMVAPPGQMSQTNLHVTPRWALYGGPISTKKVADEWHTYLQLWAQNNGGIWVPYPDGTPCVVQSFRIKWPADSSFQWTWVREVYPPQRVAKNAAGQYVWESSL
jgi:hypothetical protein